MATKTTEREETDTAVPEQQSDGPLLDLTDAAVRRMIKLAKKRGYVTHDEINEVLPDGQVDPDQIEDVLGQLSEMGINVVERKRPRKAARPRRSRIRARTTSRRHGDGRGRAARAVVVRETTAKEPTDRTDDPVRMYLREMGSVELLSREGEIAIAKRIEAGREAMIAGLCESPLTFRRSSSGGTNSSKPACSCATSSISRPPMRGPTARARQRARRSGTAPEERPPRRGATEPGRAATSRCLRSRATSTTDDLENNRLALGHGSRDQAERARVFDAIADNYKKLRRLPDRACRAAACRTSSSRPAQERNTRRSRNDVVTDVKSLSLNATASRRWSSSSTTSTSG
jgi:RNA polymerase primary sigma factor